MTIKGFIRIVIDRGCMRVNGRSNGYSTPTEVVLGCQYPLLLGSLAIRPSHMEGEMMRDQGTSSSYRLEIV
jgi:hypothetical protein